MRLAFLRAAGIMFGLMAAAHSAAALPPLQPLDLFRLSAASTPRFSPDSRMISYVRVTNDIKTDRAIRSLWLVDSRTGEESPIRADDGESFGQEWSPDGTRLAYIHAAPGSAPEIEVYWLATGRTARISRLERAPGNLAWSPDSRLIAFTMSEPRAPTVFGTPLVAPEGAHWAEPLTVIDDVHYRDDGVGPRKPGYTHIFVIPATGGAPRQLTQGQFEDDGPLAWTRDDAAIVFLGHRAKDFTRDPLENSLYRVSLADCALTRLTPSDGPYSAPRISPDGRRLAYSGFKDEYRGYENRHIFVMDLATGHTDTLAATRDLSFDNPRWAADNRSLYTDYSERGVTKVVRVGLAGGVAEIASGLASASFNLPYSGGDYDVAPDGTVAITLGAPDRPADLAAVRKGSVHQLTHLNDGLLGQRTLGRIQLLPVKSSFDGTAIDAWEVLPPGFQPGHKYPLILEIHGGPFASYGPTFATDGQLYAAAGYVVVYANPRGSTSYGEKFGNGIDRSYPGIDYDDLMSAVDAAIASGAVDPDRLFVTGGSGGGVLTTWIVGKTHRFRAAVAQKPVVNWSSEVLTSDIYPWMAKYWFGKLPWEDPVAYWKRSPLSLVGNVTTPTMVIVGAEDVRTPVPEAEQYYGALQLRGVPTALIRVPGAFHDMAARPSHSATKAEAVLAWFARYDSKAGR